MGTAPRNHDREQHDSTAEDDMRRHEPHQSATVLLRAHNLAVTPQRLLLVEVARSMPGHFTAKSVHERVQQEYPSISVVSVYRGLETFRELGLVTRTNLGGMIEQYEWVDGGRHHHLICLSCQQQQILNDNVMNELRELLRARYGFHASIDHHAIFGMCAACAALATREQDDR